MQVIVECHFALQMLDSLLLLSINVNAIKGFPFSLAAHEVCHVSINCYFLVKLLQFYTTIRDHVWLNSKCESKFANLLFLLVSQHFVLYYHLNN